MQISVHLVTRLLFFFDTLPFCSHPPTSPLASMGSFRFGDNLIFYILVIYMLLKKNLIKPYLLFILT